jgi:hypothetical protein
MSARYSLSVKLLKRTYRRVRPVPRSPWTAGHIDDICAVNLVPPQKLIRFFEDCLLTLKQIKGDETGDYLEFSVFNGNSIGSMALARQAIGMRSMRLFGFDAFEGLPPGAELEDGGVWKTGFYACSFEKMQQCLLRRNIDPGGIIWASPHFSRMVISARVIRSVLPAWRSHYGFAHALAPAFGAGILKAR